MVGWGMVLLVGVQYPVDGGGGGREIFGCGALEDGELERVRGR